MVIQLRNSRLEFEQATSSQSLYCQPWCHPYWYKQWHHCRSGDKGEMSESMKETLNIYSPYPNCPPGYSKIINFNVLLDSILRPSRWVHRCVDLLYQCFQFLNDKISLSQKSQEGSGFIAVFRDLWKTKDVFSSFSISQLQSETILYFYSAAQEIKWIWNKRFSTW